MTAPGGHGAQGRAHDPDDTVTMPAVTADAHDHDRRAPGGQPRLRPQHRLRVRRGRRHRRTPGRPDPNRRRRRTRRPRSPATARSWPPAASSAGSPGSCGRRRSAPRSARSRSATTTTWPTPCPAWSTSCCSAGCWPAWSSRCWSGRRTRDADRGEAYAQRLLTLAVVFLAGATVVAVLFAPVFTVAARRPEHAGGRPFAHHHPVVPAAADDLLLRRWRRCSRRCSTPAATSPCRRSRRSSTTSS